MKYLFMISALLVTIAGCSILPTEGFPARKYTLGYAHFTPDTDVLKVSLLIDMPTVDSSLDTLRIVIKSSERSIDYVADAEWVNRLANLIHESVLHSFENTGAFSAISRPYYSAKVDRILKISVRGFYIDSFSEPPKHLAHVDYLAQIIDKRSRRVIASKAFSARTYADAERIESYIQALNQAHVNVTMQIISWTIETIETSRPHYTTDEKESD